MGMAPQKTTRSSSIVGYSLPDGGGTLNARLIGQAGAASALSVELVGEEVSLGREAGNTVVISDSWVSRRHAVIRRDPEGYRLIDLDSRHGTRINNLPIKEHVLVHGDRVALGGSAFVFLHRDRPEDSLTTLALAIEPTLRVVDETISLRIEDAAYLRLDALPADDSAAGRAASDLKTVLNMVTALGSLHEPEALGRKLLELLFEVIPAERGGIVLLSRDAGDFSAAVDLCVVHSREPLAGTELEVHVSRTVADEVLRDRKGILSNGVVEVPAWAGSESLQSARVRSLLCVPLVLRELPLGVIYLDNSRPGLRFAPRHLELATAIGAVAALAFDTARRFRRLEARNRELQENIELHHSLVGESPKMQEIYKLISRVAPSDSTVLVRGESGTGKELVARALHSNSPRRDKPFVAVNCAALPENLLESELFGYEKGAFTGAAARKEGKIELAHEGTFFLDEIGELPLLLQAKLLRALQEKCFERVGGTRPLKVDMRLIAATNRNLDDAVKAGTFRADLYYRLNVVAITLPPLREHREDIPLLAQHFTRKLSEKLNRPAPTLSAEAKACLTAYDWPGNVRQLENAIERALVLGASEVLGREDLPEELVESGGHGGATLTGYHERLNQAKREIVGGALEQAKGTVTEAARILGLNPNYLHRLMNNLDLRPGK